MSNKKGGYIIIDLSSETLTDDLSKALIIGKPVLVYDANNKANFYTIEYESGVYNLIGANDSITIDSDGDVSINDKHLYAYIIDFTDFTIDGGTLVNNYVTIISNKKVTKFGDLFDKNQSSSRVLTTAGTISDGDVEETISYIEYVKVSNGYYILSGRDNGYEITYTDGIDDYDISYIYIIY